MESAPQTSSSTSAVRLVSAASRPGPRVSPSRSLAARVAGQNANGMSGTVKRIISGQSTNTPSASAFQSAL
ncbi:hypothetical protein ACWGLE_22095 [Streptomyces sp. NPDC055897]